MPFLSLFCVFKLTVSKSQSVSKTSFFCDKVKNRRSVDFRNELWLIMVIRFLLSELKSIIRINSLQDLHDVPEHLWSARKRHCVPSENNSFLKPKRDIFGGNELF